MKFIFCVHGNVVLISLFQQCSIAKDLGNWKSIYPFGIVGEIFTSNTGDQGFALITSLRNFVESEEICNSNKAKLVEVTTPGITPLEIVDLTHVGNYFVCYKMCVDHNRPNAFWAKTTCLEKLPSLCEIVNKATMHSTKVEFVPTQVQTGQLRSKKVARIYIPIKEHYRIVSRSLQSKSCVCVKWMVRVEERRNFKFTSRPDWGGRSFTSATCARHCQKQDCVTFTYCPESKLCEVYVNNHPDEYEPAACDIWVPTMG